MITAKHDYLGDSGAVFFLCENVKEYEICIKLLSPIKGARPDGFNWIIPESELPAIREATANLSKICKVEAEESLVSFGKHYDSINKPIDLIISCHAVKAYITPKTKLPGNFDDEITKVTRFFFKGAARNRAFKAGYWDGYICLYNKRDKSLYTGLMHIITPVLDKMGLKYKIEYLYEQRVPRQFEWTINDGITPDPDQIEAVAEGYKGLRGVLKAPTGFGKTAILAKGLISRFGVPTLFVANKIALLDDAAEDFSRGMEGDPIIIGEIKEGKFCGQEVQKGMDPIKDINSNVIVATIQSLYKGLLNPATKDVLKAWLSDTCKFIMVDECQAVGTKMWDEVLCACNAPYRIMLSATPNRTDGGKIKIYAQSGPVLFSTTAETQIEKGRLCELDISYIVHDHGLYNENDSDIEYQNAATEWIALNTDRNMQCVVNPAIKFTEEGRIVLILVTHIVHGEELLRLLLENGFDESEVRFVHGSTSSSARKSAIKELRKGEFKILIGSTIFDAGVNIPAISAVILAGAGNSEITLVQRIGRGARQVDYEEEIGYLPEFLKRNHGQKITKVIDVMDRNIKFFTAQSFNRYKNAKAEFGSRRVHIVGDMGPPKKRTASSATPSAASAASLGEQAVAPFLKEAITRNFRKGFEILDQNEVDALKAFENKKG